MARRGRRWGTTAIEVLTIVFGVLLALVLDDWRQGRDQRRVTESVLISLLVELERNQLVLESRLPVHEAMLDTLRMQADQSLPRTGQAVRVRSLRELGFPEGLGLDMSLATGAWEATKASGTIGLVDPGLLFSISAAYTTQAEVTAEGVRLRDKYDGYLLAKVEGVRPVFALIGFTGALSEIVIGEQALCEQYRTLAQRLAARPQLEGGRCGSGNVLIS